MVSRSAPDVPTYVSTTAAGHQGRSAAEPHAAWLLQPHRKLPAHPCCGPLVALQCGSFRGMWQLVGELSHPSPGGAFGPACSDQMCKVVRCLAWMHPSGWRSVMKERKLTLWSCLVVCPASGLLSLCVLPLAVCPLCSGKCRESSLPRGGSVRANCDGRLRRPGPAPSHQPEP